MHPTIAKLISAGPVVTDGAWGTQLQERGLPVGACPDAWNLTQPVEVEQVARTYVEAGSRVILTNTFGANRFILARHGLAGRAAEINRLGVEISRRAAKKWGLAPSFAGQTPQVDDPARCLSPFLRGGAPAVFASIGPSGLMLMLGQVERGRSEGRLCRAGPGHCRRRRGRHRRRDDVRSGRGGFGGRRRP